MVATVHTYILYISYLHTPILRTNYHIFAEAGTDTYWIRAWRRMDWPGAIGPWVRVRVRVRVSVRIRVSVRVRARLGLGIGLGFGLGLEWVGRERLDLSVRKG